jgi:KipI family sensor histidine kinase inhibitor
VLVPVDPLAGTPDELLPTLDNALRDADDRPVEAIGQPSGALHELPTRYGRVDGPDLDEVAALHGLRPADVVELHASVEYRVYMLGFAPGFAYLGRVPEAIATPRRSEPRERVLAGSVGIARDQTGVYPFETPAGWNIIGRTEVRVWDTVAARPNLLAPGDRVRFIPVR